MIFGQDLCLPFDIPAPICFNASNAYSSFKLEMDLPLPFEELNMAKRKPFFKVGVSKYRRQRKPAARVQARLPRVKLEFPQAPPNNRNSRPGPRRKANVLVQVDCSQTSALQSVRYIENKRVVFAMWSGSSQWSHHSASDPTPHTPQCHRFVLPTISQVHVLWGEQSAHGARGRSRPQPRPRHRANHARNQDNVQKALQKS
jgi:hypothetical protein